MSGATTLLLIRHGETAWNAEHRIQGQLDVPLSPHGIWQARRLADRLARERIDAVVASDLARAWLTAVPAAEAFDLEPRPDARLRERRFGIFEGQTLEEVAARWPDEFARWRERDPAWTIPEGESGQDLIERVMDALHDYTVAHAGGTVAVIAHGGTLDVAYRAARALAWDAPRQHLMGNANINRIAALAAPLRLEIVEWGDAAHLEQAHT